ncbi:MAG: DUF3617 domain-containing protein [Betaproteobacteria bacterium]|nr:DUF3617 domain-containing protein [Betaproteobacteria bacterium]
MTLPAPLPAGASEPRLPELRPGLWQFQGREGGRKIDSRKCASPSEELRAENAALAKLGCTFTSPTPSHDTYRYQSRCDLTTRRGRALTSQRNSVIKVRGDQAFELTVKGTSNGNPVDDLIVGKRIGECNKPVASRPAGKKP